VKSAAPKKEIWNGSMLSHTVFKNVRFFFLFCLLGIQAPLLAAKPVINVVYPREGRTVTAASKDSTFIFGQVKPVDAKLAINGFAVPLYANGAFLAYLPITPGDFTFDCLAVSGVDSSCLQRHVSIPPLPQPISGDSLRIDGESIIPQRNWRLHQGDLFRVSFRGTPKCQASFSIEGVREDIPMAESALTADDYWGEVVFGQAAQMASYGQGSYSGSYLLQPLDWGEKRKITFRLISAADDTLEVDAPGHLTVFDNSLPQVGETIPELGILRTAPYLGYYYFLPQGVRLWIDGQAGPYLRVRLSDNEEAWVESWNVRMLPDGTAPPHSVVSVVRTENLGKKSRVLVFTGVRVPFRIEQIAHPQTLRVFFYGIDADTDWIRHDFTDPLIREIRWTQTARGTFELRIELNEKQQWGYNAFYDEHDNFVLDIKKQPKLRRWPHSPLKDLFVMLDPGHGPDAGAVGPTGLSERVENLLLAETVKKKLEDKGAFVYLARSGEEGASLNARPRIAAALNPDILLSLHHNALPDGVNPFKSRGTSTYYYHPQSYELAKLVHKKLLVKLRLPDFGLFYDNLALCRPPQMPAVLVEPAFMMHPEEEMQIGSPKYRQKVADALADAMEEFLREAKD